MGEENNYQMCKWGTYKEIALCEPMPISKRTTIKVDSCIADLIQALNDSKIATIASCCGHNKRPGRISLKDGRELFIVTSYEEAQKIEETFNNMGYSPIN